MELRFVKVCQDCFKRDDVKDCPTCHGRHLIDLIPAIVVGTGETTHLEIIQ